MASSAPRGWTAGSSPASTASSTRRSRSRRCVPPSPRRRAPRSWAARRSSSTRSSRASLSAGPRSCARLGSRRNSRDRVASMPVPRKTVVWFEDGKRPNVADRLEKEPEIDFRRLSYGAPKVDNWRALSSAHVYCITSTRQELPEEYRCGAALLARCPDLLAVSTSGAGYDTVDAAACTAAGVLVVNQSGANADAVAEHALAMMLSLAKNIPQTDRSLRAARG